MIQPWGHLALLALVAATAASRSRLSSFISPAEELHVTEGDPGLALFLTPLIEAGNLTEARQLSRVTELATDVESYAGYLTVNKRHNSNLFFWFFPAKAKPETAPVVLWLQGGPGGSSMFGLFVEHGPFSVTSDFKLMPRPTSWSLTHNMIYIDNPVGTGFSFTGDEGGYARNETTVGKDLHTALLQFFTVFPEYSKLPFYATGESYAGKYVPAISHTIIEENPTAKLKINFKGMAIGDGLCDPITQVDYGDFLYGVGLIDKNVRRVFYKKQAMAKQFILQKKYPEAAQVFDEMLADFEQATGLSFYYNYELSKAPVDFAYYSKFINQASVRHAIHVGALPFHSGEQVYSALADDFMRSVKPWIVDILNRGYRVMIYNGQMDVIIAYTLTENFVDSIEWKNAEVYRNATRNIWRVGNDVAGYVREAANLVQVMVRDAGHILPYDQPKWALDMISRFTTSKHFQ